MSQTGPWSVKGIDARAREAARERARQEGMTLGEYLNSLILKGGEVGAQDIVAPISAPKPRPQAGASSLNKLVSRIEAAEARSTLAITGIDQSVVGLLKRIEDAETEHVAMARHVDGVIDDIRSTYEALREKVRRIEEDDSAEQNLEALKALENALGKLASHVYEENALVQTETDAIKGRVEAGFGDINERLEHMDTKVEQTLTDAARRVEKAVEQAELRAEGTARHLSERMSTLDTKIGRQERSEEEMNGRLQEAEARVGITETALEDANARVDSIESDVTTALESMEGTLLRVQDRLNRAETTTDAALKSLESTFDVLDQRIGEVAKAAPDHAAELRAQFEQRFEGLADDLRASIDATRAELASEIENAAKAGITPAQLETFETKLGDVQRRLSDNEDRHARAIETVGDQVSRISENFDQRLQDVESADGSAKVAEQFSKLTEAVQDRLEQIEQREASAIERVGDEMTKIADQLDERISDSEQRSASAIEQVGEQVARVATRLQTRQDEALQSFSDKLDESQSRSESRLSDALASVSQRLDLMQEQSSNTLSPVQKAIASLATRLDSLEEFAAPPFADAPQAAALPEMRPLPINAPLFSDEIASRADVDMDVQGSTQSTQDLLDELSEQEDPSSYNDAVASSIQADLEDSVPADTTTDDEFEPGIESWDDVRDETDASDEPSEFTAEVPPADGSAETDPVAELENWEESASEARDIDVFDDVFDKPDELSQKNSPVLTAPADTNQDYLQNARAAARNAAASPDDTKSKRGKQKEKKAKTPKAGQTETAKKSSGGSSKLPLVATASVVALAAAGGTAYYAMQNNESIDLQKISTPPMPAAPAPTEIADTAPATGDATLDAITGDPMDPDALFEETPGDASLTAAPTPSVAPVSSEPVEADTPPPASEPTPTESPRAEAPQPDPAPEETVLAAAPAPEPRPTLPQIAVPVTLESAAASGDPKALYTLGKSELDDGNFADGAGLMKRSAEAGEPAAQYRLGKLHEKGLGVPRDLTLARKWTESAANGGNVRAMHDLAVFYAQGDGGPQSYAAAVNWFRKAAEFGVVDSQYNLGVLYERGIGIEPDPTEALFWFVIAARGGDAASAAKIQELSKALPVDAANSATSRAQGWTPKPASDAANGIYAGQSYGGVTPQHIAQVQAALNAFGYSVGKPDGEMGPATSQAIRVFQGEHGLSPTGTVTPELIRKINEQTAS